MTKGSQNLYLNLLFLLFYILLPWLLFSQNDHLQMADSLKFHYEAKNYETCSNIGEKLLANKSVIHEKTVLNTWLYTGICLEEQWKNTKALVYLEQLFDYYETNNLVVDTLFAKAKLSASSCLDRLGRGEEAISSCQEVIDAENELAQNPEFLALAFNQLGNSHEAQDQFDLALENYQEALQRYQEYYQGEKHIDIGKVYNNLAIVHKELNYFKEADDYFQKALSIFLETVGEKDRRTLSIYYNMGYFLFDIQGDVGRALECLNNALDISLEIFPPNHRLIASISDLLVYIYTKEGNYTLAKTHLQTTERIRHANVENDPIGLFYCLQQAGELYLRTKEFSQSEIYLQKARIQITSLPTRMPSLERSIYGLTGELFEAKGELKKAKFYHQKAYEISKTTIGQEHPESIAHQADMAYLLMKEKNYEEANEILDQIILQITKENLSLNSLSNRKLEVYAMVYSANGEALKHLFLEEKVESLEKALEQHQKALEAFDIARARVHHPASKISLKEKHRGLFSEALTCYAIAQQETPSNENLQSIFNILERSKAYLLLDAITHQRTQKYAGVPDSLIRLEKVFKKEVEELETYYFELEEVHNEEGRALKSNLFQKKEALEQLIRQFSRDYPDYYRLKYPGRLQYQLAEFQQLLSINDVAIHYFMGENQIFALKICSDKTELHLLEKDQLFSSQVENFNNLIEQFPNYQNAAPEIYSQKKEAYQKLGYELYQRLIAPLGTLPTNINIIPDEILWQIPFEALLKDNQIKSFRQMPYLIHDHTFSYNYSAALWMEMKHKKVENSKNILVLAPGFSDSDNSQSLTYSLDEAREVQKIWNGKLLVEQQANKSNFLKLAPEYSVLHFATHAFVNDSDNRFSYLSFSKDQNKEDKIYLNELYNIDLPNNMVVLNACATAKGQLKDGEGLISLARGFIYAGAESIFTTNWPVNDQVAANVMQQFHYYLREGYAKNEALRQSKIDYIQQQKEDLMAHPFYWAPYLGFGNMEALSIPQKRRFSIWVWGGLMTLLILLVGWRRKLKDENSKGTF